MQDQKSETIETDIGAASLCVRDVEDWDKLNSRNKTANPKFLEKGKEEKKEKIFYKVNFSFLL